MKKNRAFNFLANLSGTIVNLIVNFIFVPFYIKILGEEAYGLITFFVTLQTFLNILGMGLSKSLRRDFSNPLTDDCYKYKMLKNVECIYLLIAAVIISFTFGFSDIIATKWLNFDNLTIEAVSMSIKLMGASIGFQILSNLFLGCLYGLEKHVQANVWQMGWLISRQIVSLLLIAFLKNDVVVFFLTNAAFDLLFYVLLRIFLIGIIKQKGFIWKFQDLRELKNSISFILGLVLVSIAYSINTQLDKLIISKFLTVTEVGAYNSAFSLARLTSMIPTALSVTFFSKFTQLFEKKDAKLKEKLLFVDKFSIIVVCSMSVFMSVFSDAILSVWLQSEIIVDIIKGNVIWIIGGNMFLSMQIVLYEYLLACKKTKYNIIMSVSNIILNIFVSPFVIRAYGIQGSSIFYFGLMCISTIVYLFICFKCNLKERFFKYYLYNFILPFILITIFAVSLYWGASLVITSKLLMLAVGVMGGIIELGIYIWFQRKKIVTFMKEMRE